ncbi:hypothetical protein BGZ47_009694 [Haplosporangium gracile]|nr:hypothetical protein BGZ47_009694 [Haplosporangium gracile]
MNPTLSKDEYLMQSLAQSKRRMTPTSEKLKVECPTPPPRTHSLRPMISTPGKVEYPMQLLRAQSKRPMISIPGKVEYPTPPPRTHSLQSMPISGKVKYPTQPRVHSGSALIPSPEKADYFPSNNDKQDLNAAVEKASQEKRMVTIAKLCTKCNCRDYIGWCKDCKACFDCCPDFIDI